jgi:hypothetical protein
MKLTYVPPAITSVHESDLETALGPVLLSSVDLSTIQAESADSAIHAAAPGHAGSGHAAGGSTGFNPPGRRR